MCTYSRFLYGLNSGNRLRKYYSNFINTRYGMQGFWVAVYTYIYIHWGRVTSHGYGYPRFHAVLLQQSSGHMYLDLQSQRQDLNNLTQCVAGYQKDWDIKQTVKHTRITGNLTWQWNNGYGRMSESCDPLGIIHFSYIYIYILVLGKIVLSKLYRTIRSNISQTNT